MYHRCRNCNRAIEIKPELGPHHNFKKKAKRCQCGKPELTRAERDRIIQTSAEVYRSDGKHWVLNEARTHFEPYIHKHN